METPACLPWCVCGEGREGGACLQTPACVGPLCCCVFVMHTQMTQRNVGLQEAPRLGLGFLELPPPLQSQGEAQPLPGRHRVLYPPPRAWPALPRESCLEPGRGKGLPGVFCFPALRLGSAGLATVWNVASRAGYESGPEASTNSQCTRMACVPICNAQITTLEHEPANLVPSLQARPPPPQRKPHGRFQGFFPPPSMELHMWVCSGESFPLDSPTLQRPLLPAAV